jgi:hypothetical protein
VHAKFDEVAHCAIIAIAYVSLPIWVDLVGVHLALRKIAPFRLPGVIATPAKYQQRRHCHPLHRKLCIIPVRILDRSAKI